MAGDLLGTSVTMQTFDDWFNELEGFGFRSERFYAAGGTPELVEWLKAAYAVGHEAGCAIGFDDGYDEAIRHLTN